MIQQDSTKVTWGQVYNDVKGALEGAADALKTGAEHVYEILVRQQVTNSITNIFIYAVIASIALVAFRIFAVRYSRREKKGGLASYEGPLDFADVLMPMLVGCAATVVFVIVVITTMHATITGFVNPEYGALMEIKSFIR